MQEQHWRVLLVDSSVGVRGTAGALLGSRGWSILADSGEASVGSLVAAFDPDIAVVELGDREPSEFVQIARADRPIPLIATLPLSASPHLRAEVLRAGVDDTLVKPFDIEELVVRIEATMLCAGKGASLEFENVRLDEVGHTVTRDINEIQLTVTEFNLLGAFLRNPGRVMSKRQLLSTVWGFDDYDVNLVEVHVSALRRKLEEHGPRIIQTVRGIGYVLRHAGPNGFRNGTRVHG